MKTLLRQHLECEEAEKGEDWLRQCLALPSDQVAAVVNAGSTAGETTELTDVAAILPKEELSEAEFPVPGRRGLGITEHEREGGVEGGA